MAEPAIRRVLVYRLGSLGDMAIAVPLFRLVRRAFPGAEVRLLTNTPVHRKAPAATAVLGGSGLVQGYFPYTVQTRSPWALGSLALRVRLWRPEVAVYLVAARGMAAAQRDLRFLRLCGVQRVIGVPLTSALQSNFHGAEPGSGAAQTALMEGTLEPETARLARCVAELGDAQMGDPASWSLGLLPSEQERAAALLGDGQEPWIAVSVGTKVQAKDWGVENWQALLRKVAERAPGHRLVLLGAPDEAAASSFAAEGWQRGGGGTVLNLCGQVTPRESAAVLERCRLFVGHDSGPMHLAASAGTPVVAIFAARNIPRKWFPAGTGHEILYHRVECWGCELETCIEQGKKCLRAIRVEQAADAVERVLLRTGG